MIASVVVTLSPGTAESVCKRLASRPGIELGEKVAQRIPLTIECDDRGGMEDTTRWIQDQKGVLFVDVVFVHFENDVKENSGGPAARPLTAGQQNLSCEDGADEQN